MSVKQDIDVHFQKEQKFDRASLSIKGTYVEIVESFKFLGTYIKETLTWDNNYLIILKKLDSVFTFYANQCQVKKPVL